MNKKKILFFLLPIFVTLIVYVALLWINYFTQLDYKLIYYIVGITLMIVGFYLVIVLFISADDEEKKCFKDLLKDIGVVLGTGLAGLLVYAAGYAMLFPELAMVQFDLSGSVYYVNMAVIAVSGLGLLRVFVKKDARRDASAFQVVALIVCLVCAVAGFVVFLSQFNPILLNVTVTLVVGIIFKVIISTVVNS